MGSTVYTVAEAATRLGISRSKLYELVAAGEVPHRRIRGAGVKFTAEDLDAILAEAYRPAVAR